VGHTVASSATVVASQWNWGQDSESTIQVTECFPRTKWQCRSCNYLSRRCTVERTQAASGVSDIVPGAQASMESGTPAHVAKECQVQGKPSASLGAAPRASSSLLACPTSAVSALSHCSASASLTGLVQACPSAPMTPACPCCFADRANVYPVPRYLVPAFCSTLTPCSQLPWPPGSVCSPHLSPLFPLVQYPDSRCLLCSFPLQVFVKISAPQ